MKKIPWIGMVVGAFLLLWNISPWGAIPVGNWGLGFGEEGTVPSGSASTDALAEYGGAYVGDTAEPKIYLTFDAGFENGQTGEILDILKEKQVPATFFLVGNYLETQPDLVKRMVAEGHVVGNHTYHHYDMSKIGTLEEFQAELQSVEEKYQEITGEDRPKYYRPPQGIYSEENLKMAHELGYHTVFWSLAYVDWYQDKQPTHQEAFDKLLPRIHNGAVLLLHSTSQTNLEILGELIDKYREMGYEFAAIDQLFPPESLTDLENSPIM